MLSVSAFLPRPFLSAGLSTLLVGALVLSGCSSPPKATKTPVVVPTTPTTTTTTAVAKRPPPPPPPVPTSFKARGMSAELAAVIKPLYLGGAVPSSPSAAKVLRKRKPVKATGRSVVVSTSVAGWKGELIAVVTHGKDVTLAVKAPKWKVVGGWWPSLGVSAPSLGSGPRRVLVVGSDARPGQSVSRSRADSLHIVGFDGRGGGGVLGIARDSYVALATGGQGKINAASVYGGSEALQRTVVSATGVPVEGYLITGFHDFKLLIHGIGGLSIDIPVSVKDSGSHVDVKAGPNKLTGSRTLAYGRARKAVAGGDFGRSSNQGLIIKAAGGMVKLAGPARLPRILGNAAPRIGTNMSAEQVLTFAAGAYVTNPARIPNRVAPGGIGTSSDGQSIVLLNAKAMRLFADIRDGNLS